MNQKWEHTADTLLSMLKQDQMKFSNVIKEPLSGFALACINLMVEPYGLEWKIGKSRPDQAVCVQLSDDMVGYLFIFPDDQKFLWVRKDLNDSISPDEVLVRFVKKIGINARIVDGTRNVVVSTPSGSSVIVDPRKP